MIVLMLGNGFDLNCGLPTTYLNFLNVVEELHEIWRDNPEVLQTYDTAGSVFAREGLQIRGGRIKENYESHREAFDQTTISRTDLELLAKLPETNLWCRYFLNTHNKDLGWIDFEKEINCVINAFKSFFEAMNRSSWSHTETFALFDRIKDAHDRLVIEQMDFFLKRYTPYYRICEDYLTKPYAQLHGVLNEEKIINRLNDDLKAFADALKVYFCIFVDGVVEHMVVARKSKANHQSEWFEKMAPEYVVTFNYTKTFEKYCPNVEVMHIHGSLDGNIVLGVNPDLDDEYTTADTRFISFKKYFQRIVYGTDVSYRSFVDTIESISANSSLHNHLVVMGHSLDITDKDIIQELFGIASKITVMYFSQKALGTSVAKLIEMYGKEEFDRLRTQKGLSFVSQAQDSMENFLDEIGESRFAESFI